MTSRPVPTYVVHFTHVSHLATIATKGLLSDTAAKAAGLLSIEVGNQEIKAARRSRLVDMPPGGAVADYAPFYFAPRSPMMYAIAKGNVPTYKDGCEELIYLITTVERLIELHLRTVFTDRNAALAFTTFANDSAKLDNLIDWQLMKERMWNNTPEQPDRMERRMAECLVHQRVPWSAFLDVTARNSTCARQARQLLATVDSGVRHVSR
ncbi:MAG: type II toxin-antitoxin system toxin DNA ADP-ribosyl transferase DarT [Haloechinothrix sp.]